MLPDDLLPEAHRLVLQRDLGQVARLYANADDAPCLQHVQSFTPVEMALVLALVYMLYADLVGARNIAMQMLFARQDLARTGHLSVAPDVSDRETKAARLTRYAELR